MYVILTKDLNEEMRELSMFKVVAASLSNEIIKENMYHVYEAVNVENETYVDMFEEKTFKDLFIEVSEENFDKYKKLVEEARFEEAEDLSYKLIKENDEK